MKLSQLIEILNRDIKPQFWFKLDPIYSVDNNEGLVYLGRAESILKDITHFPFNLYLRDDYLKYLKCKKIIFWINDKLFLFMLESIITKKEINTFTNHVRLRIAKNMIFNNTDLTKDEKIKWSMTLSLVYHNRQKTIVEYYWREIEKLPF